MSGPHFPMDWIFKNIPLLMFVFVVISIVRAIAQARETSARHEAGQDETEDQRRVREIQERIRRKIAERRGETGPVPAEPPSLPSEAPAPRTVLDPAPPVAELDPFGGPLKRVLAELERKAAPAPAHPAPVLFQPDPAELERQARLVAEMKALEEARHLAERRAAHAAEERAAAAVAEPAVRAAMRDHLLEDLRDPASLRRAFLLRELIGPPVGLR